MALGANFTRVTLGEHQGDPALFLEGETVSPEEASAIFVAVPEGEGFRSVQADQVAGPWSATFLPEAGRRIAIDRIITVIGVATRLDPADPPFVWQETLRISGRAIA